MNSHSRRSRPPACALTRAPSLIFCAVVLACENESAVVDTWHTVTANAGDTTVVRTVGAITGSADIRIEETLAIGKADGPDAETFGRILQILPARDGGVFIVERNPHRIRKFDSGGRFLSTYGARGQGPGEYLISGVVAEDGAGFLLHWPPTAPHIAIYDSTATFVRQIPHGRRGVPLAGFSDSGRTLLTEWLTSEADGTGSVREVRRLVALDSSGTAVDSFAAPAPFGERVTVQYSSGQGTARYLLPLSPTFQLASRGDGSWVYGTSELYVIHVYGRGVPRLRIESDLPATAARAEERRDMAEYASLELRSADANATVTAADIPEQKPFFRRLFTDADQRIWVLLHGEATRHSVKRCPPSGLTFGAAGSGNGCPDGRDSVRMNEWIEPSALDVYAGSGEFLGRLRLPDNSEWMAARGDHLWVVRQDANQVEQVVRYHMTFRTGGKQGQ